MIQLGDMEWSQAEIQAEVEDALIAYPAAKETTLAVVDTVVDANAAKLALVQPDSTDNLNTIAASQATNLDLARAGDSGTTTMDGSELTIYEETDTTAFVC